MPGDAVEYQYATKPTVVLRKEQGRGAAVDTVLGGARLVVLERDGAWCRVRSFESLEGWVASSEVGENTYLRLSFIDVGQGDGVLVELPRHRFLVDGGTSTRSVLPFLAGHQYKGILKEPGAQVDLTAAFISHFDSDHYAGMIDVIEDERFRIGTIFHQGVARFDSKKAERPDGYTELGLASGAGKDEGLDTTWSTLDDLIELRDEIGGLSTEFRAFVDAAEAAHAAGRLTSLQRLRVGDDLSGVFDLADLTVDVLGPVPAADGRLPWFEDASHTINGNSVVLKVRWKERTALLGGDLNEPAEQHLLAHHGPERLRVDVAKACHHGSSDFDVPFVRAVGAAVTVISSGDDKAYGHPAADLVGAVGRHAAVGRPLVFSTELARSTGSDGEVLFGLINVRSDGDWVVGAQMLDKSGADRWAEYVLDRSP
jgi:beta-lactamase superfamily II metal-dependent hydrolase